MPEAYLVSLLSGGTAGIVVDITLFPLDTIKTRIQSSHGFIKAGGFHGIYSGIASAATGSAPAAATFFCTYEAVKNLSGPLSRNLSQPFIHMLAASFGEMVSNVVRVPFEVVKQRAQAYKNTTSQQALKFTYQQEGFKGLYRGYWNTVFREVPFSFIQYPLWEYLKSKWSHYQERPVHPWQSGLCGAVAGGIAAAITTPLDVAKTRVMLAKVAFFTDPGLAVRGFAQPDPGQSLLGSIVTDKDCPTTKVNPFKVLYLIGSQEGLLRLFSGLVPRVLWISVGGAVFLGVYDEAKTQFSIIL